MSKIFLTLVTLLAVLLCGELQAETLRIDRISSTVSSLKRSVPFYERGLGFHLVRYEDRDGDDYARLVGVPQAQARVAIMQLGSEEIELVQYAKRGKPIPRESRSPDLWFQHFAIVVSDMEKAYAQLRKLRPVEISVGGPQQLPPSTGSVKAFKFKDPDGHPLELLNFPVGAGRPIWHEQKAEKLFLGIDHTAIAISDTESSRTFYADLLKLQTSYESINSGPTQEALDGTLGAVVRITGERTGPDGIGLELLDYRTPPTGRTTPIDTITSDIVHMHTVLHVDDLDQIVLTLRQHKVPMISPEPEPLTNGLRGVMVRDPDRHALLLVGE